MMNQVKETIILRYLNSLSAEEIAQVIQKLVPDKKVTIETPFKGDIRVVNLPNIAAASDFDDLMEVFKDVHGLTSIS